MPNTTENQNTTSTTTTTTTSTRPPTTFVVLKHHCKETYERDEEFICLSNTSTTTMSSPTTPQDELKHQHQQHQPKEDPPKSTSTLSSEEHQQTQEEEEPYQELKWNDLPLFLNDTLQTDELLARDKQTLPIHAGRTALLVVDVQPEYWSQCPAVRAEFPHFPAQLAQLVEHCRQQKCKIIWVRADYRYAHSPWLVQFARLHQGAKIPNEVYTPSDAEVQWEDFATPQGGEYVIPKTSWSSTRHTALMDLLKQSGIDTVLVCGLITSVCVQHSAFGIFEAGYRTLLVTDACADRGKARHDAALALYGDYMYELVTVQDLCTSGSDFYMRPAEPVWLTPHHIETLVQPQIFNTLQDSVVGSIGGIGGCYYDCDDDNEEEEGDADQRTTTTSNKQQAAAITHYYKVDKTTKEPVHQEKQQQQQQYKTPSMGNATTRTSNSSLSTLSSRQYQGLEQDEEPQQLVATKQH